MKKTKIKFLAFVTILGLSLAGCSDTTDPVIGTTTPATLATPANDMYVLSLDQADEAMATLEWQAAGFGAQVAINYDVQLDIAGNGFQKPVLLGSTNETSLDVKVGDMNKYLLAKDLPAGKAVDVEIRVVSSIATISGLSNYESGYSNTVTLHVTPYSDEKVYPMLYTPGDHQGWKPDVAAPIYSVDDNGIYEGYVQLNGGFKFTSETSWNGTNYGPGAAEGLLSTAGDAGNISAAEGYYYVKVNTNELTYTIAPRAWGVIGDATPTGWESDTKLVYDPADMTLKVDMTLKDGFIKFRANDDWNVNLGGSLDAPVAGGDNIAVKAGTYTLVLDLHRPEHKAMLIEK